MTDWPALERELDAWAKAGDTATLWWRDDDAVADTPALRRLIAATAAPGGGCLPLALAVIPAHADATLVERVGAASSVTVLQHGWCHANNAMGKDKKAEFPANRDADAGLDELRQGRERLEAMFGSRFVPMLVPPWNRIDQALIDRLVEVGLTAMSSYGRRNHSTGRRQVRIVNTHVDIINWREERRFMGTGACLALLIGHLRDRRDRRAERAEATGLLTHHLVQDDDAWAFMAELVRRTAGQPAARWLDVRRLVEG